MAERALTRWNSQACEICGINEQKENMRKKHTNCPLPRIRTSPLLFFPLRE
jgi:hypothetical protein